MVHVYTTFHYPILVKSNDIYFSSELIYLVMKITGCDKIEFFSFLMNVSGPIDRLRLKNGFEIEPLSRDDFVTLMKSHGPSMFTGWTMAQLEFPKYRDKKNLYVVRKTFDATVENEERRLCLGEGAKIFSEKYETYLDNVLTLLNLLGEGSIFAPERCYQYYEGERKSCFIHEQRYQPPLPMPFKYDIEKIGIEVAQYFIDNTTYPFEKPYIQLATDNFLESYFTRNLKLSFLSLMMALEALLSRDNQELTYTIRRNTAVLLGSTVDQSEAAYRDINTYYKKRSKIVHGDEGTATTNNVVTPEDIMGLREYVRKSILKTSELNIDKIALLDALNRRGFPN